MIQSACLRLEKIAIFEQFLKHMLILSLCYSSFSTGEIRLIHFVVITGLFQYESHTWSNNAMNNASQTTATQNIS